MRVKIKKLLKLACVAIHTRHLYLQFYFCAIDFHNFILQEEKNRADLKYDDIKSLHATSENTECGRIRNVNIQLRLNTRKTVPFWKFNFSSYLVIDSYGRNKRAGQKSPIFEPYKHTCFPHTGISKQHNLQEKITSFKMRLRLISCRWDCACIKTQALDIIPLLK